MRTYTSSRSSRKSTSSPQPTTKRPLAERLSFHNTPQSTRAITSSSALFARSKIKHKNKNKEDQPPKNLTQLHFTLESSILRTCPLCDLTYTKGAPEDETLHNSHCARVRKGMQWRREEERAVAESHICDVATDVKLKGGKSGRIISFNADVGGKIGTKVGFHPNVTKPYLTECDMAATSQSWQHFYRQYLCTFPHPHLLAMFFVSRRSTSSFFRQRNSLPAKQSLAVWLPPISLMLSQSLHQQKSKVPPRLPK